MRQRLLANLAVLAVTLAGPAVAADMPLKAETPFAARFNWTGCYLGGHLGGGQEFDHRPDTIGGGKPPQRVRP